MEIDALVSEILKRVQEKLAVVEAGADPMIQEPESPKLLILNSTHGSNCHQILENVELAAHYRVDCALQKDYNCNLNDYEAVIAYSLTNVNLGKIANGIFDDGYCKLFGEAILAGKKTILLKEEIELYRSEHKESPYYNRLLSNLKLLFDSGVETVTDQALLPRLLAQQEVKHANKQTMASNDLVAAKALKEISISKRVITEKDIAAACREKVDTIFVDEKALLTDLAKDYAKKRKVAIQRKEGCLLGGQKE